MKKRYSDKQNPMLNPLQSCTPGQRKLAKAHGTPAEFARGCYEAVPDFISMDEARRAIEKYNREWSEAK